jgi:hypothetical protein
LFLQLHQESGWPKLQFGSGFGKGTIMTTITIEVPDLFALQLKPLRDRLPDILPTYGLSQISARLRRFFCIG